MLLIGAITDIVVRHVPDKQVLRNITLELQKIMEVDRDPTYALNGQGASEYDMRTP
jgi:hypothetical protein